MDFITIAKAARHLSFNFSYVSLQSVWVWRELFILCMYCKAIYRWATCIRCTLVITSLELPENENDSRFISEMRIKSCKHHCRRYSVSNEILCRLTRTQARHTCERMEAPPKLLRVEIKQNWSTWFMLIIRPQSIERWFNLVGKFGSIPFCFAP